MSKSKQKYSYIFPYEKPRISQEKGMKVVDKAAVKGGIVTMEGACGTGKTLTALTPYISKVRESGNGIERTFIVTKVKQQMKAFQDEVDKINENLDDEHNPITAITLVGVSDLHPFVEQGLITSDFYSAIDTYRENTRMLVEDSNYSFSELYTHARDNSGPNDEYAYAAEIPEVNGVRFDPYYAKYRADYEQDADDEDILEMIPFDTETAGLLSAERLRTICAENGYCPHSIMRIALPYMELIIGNYTHVFDEKTVNRITNPVLDSETLMIIDEAHNLAPRVREFLSKSASLTSIQKAITEIREVRAVYQLAKLTEGEVNTIMSAVETGETDSIAVGDNADLAKELQSVLSSNGTVLKKSDDIMDSRNEVRSVIDDLRISPIEIEDYIKYLNDLSMVISKQVESASPIDEETSIQLRDPEKPDYDKISDWTELNPSHSLKSLGKAGLIGKAVELSRSKLVDSNDTPRTRARSVGELLTAWYEKDHISYYRAIEIDEKFKLTGYEEHPWQDDYSAKLTLHNCIPKDEISAKLDLFHSSTLMSATLEPLDIFTKTTGIDKLEEDSGRPVYKCQYGLNFPRENRDTIAVPARKFKYNNRENAFTRFGPNTGNKTRKEYRDVVFDICRNTQGNSLVVMPNYKEADWIGSLLENSKIYDSKDVYIDESSTDAATSKMREDFFSSDNAVLVTGARGTLIEGIDYIEDRLHSVVVCGVPITNTSSDYMTAIQAAYDAEFDILNGFTLAFTIPAVWKTRQAMGRVIRTDEDRGTRTIVDSRYVSDDWDSVKEFLSDGEKREMKIVEPEDVGNEIDSFWNGN